MTDVLVLEEDGEDDLLAGSLGNPESYMEGDSVLGGKVQLRVPREEALKPGEVNTERPPTAVGGNISGGGSGVGTVDLDNLPLARGRRPATAEEQAVAMPVAAAALTDEDRVCQAVVDRIGKTKFEQNLKTLLPGLGFPSHIHMPEGLYDAVASQARVLLASPDSPTLRVWVQFARACKGRLWSAPALAQFITTGLVLSLIGAHIMAPLADDDGPSEVTNEA